MFDITKLFDEYKDTVNEEELAENVIKFIQEKKVFLEEQLIYFMEISNITELAFDDDVLTLKADVFPNILVSNHDKLKEFLGEDKKEVFNESPTKLKSYINKMIDDDKVIPDFVNLFIKPTIKLKEAKKSKRRK